MYFIFTYTNLQLDGKLWNIFKNLLIIIEMLFLSQLIAYSSCIIIEIISSLNWIKKKKKK